MRQIFADRCLAVIGIAVAASIETGIISADIHALAAPAVEALAGSFWRLWRMAGNTGNSLQINTAAWPNPIDRQIHGFAAGADAQPMGSGDTAKLPRQNLHFIRSGLSQAAFLYALIKIKKADDNLIGIETKRLTIAFKGV